MKGAVFAAADNHHPSPEEKLGRGVQVAQERSIELKPLNGTWKPFRWLIKLDETTSGY
jgi:hypothetical protein